MKDPNMTVTEETKTTPMKEPHFSESESPARYSEEEKREALEAILFAAGYPVPYEKLAEVLCMTVGSLKKFVKSVAEDYNEEPGRGILLLVMEDACQLCTKSRYKDSIRDALGIRLSGKLSASCLEVLAIIAYRQPVTKAFIEQVRGVDCSYALGALSDKSLIEAKGRLDAPGKPILYGTTADFLRCFGIDSLSQLPESDLEGLLGDSTAEKKDLPAANRENSGIPCIEPEKEGEDQGDA